MVISSRSRGLLAVGPGNHSVPFKKPSQPVFAGEISLSHCITPVATL